MREYFAFAVGTVCALALLLPQAAAGQQQHEYNFTDVQGNKIAWSCRGTGKPTIALLAGMGLTAHDSFGRIYHNYDGSGRICMYDRAGMGESTFVDPHTRTLSDLVDEFHELAAGDDWGKMVLVPHSFAGFIARAYTDKYPDEVLGILFLDVAHEDWLPRLHAQMSASDWAIMERILAWNESTFHEDYIQAQEAVRDTRLPDDLPITILSRGIPHTRIRLEHMSYDGIDIFEREHQALQADLLNLSSNSERRIAEYSSHVFNDYDPWIVIDEIKKLAHRIEKAQ